MPHKHEPRKSKMTTMATMAKSHLLNHQCNACQYRCANDRLSFVAGQFTFLSTFPFFVIIFVFLVLEFLWWQIRWRRAERKERLQKNPWSLEMTQISEKEKVFAKKIEGKAKTNMNMVELWESLEKHFYIYINIKHSKC